MIEGCLGLEANTSDSEDGMSSAKVPGRTSRLLAQKHGQKHGLQPAPSPVRKGKTSREVQLLNFSRVHDAEQMVNLKHHKHYRARRLLLFQAAVGCVSGKGDMQFLDRRTRYVVSVIQAIQETLMLVSVRRSLLPDLALPRNKTGLLVEDTATISKNIAVVAYTNVAADSPYQASIVDFRNVSADI